MKNEKFLLDIQTKCGDIANESLNTANDAERTFKCKWPYIGQPDLNSEPNKEVDKCETQLRICRSTVLCFDYC